MVLGSLGSFLSYEKVMRSLGWSPSEVEVQVSCIIRTTEGLRLTFSSGDDQWNWPGWQQSNQFQWVCLADDKVALCFIITTSLQLFSREIYDQEIENEIRDAFIIFDKEGHGFISSAGFTNLQFLKFLLKLMLRPHQCPAKSWRETDAWGDRS